MPKVNGKEYPYTIAGKAAAKRAASKMPNANPLPKKVTEKMKDQTVKSKRVLGGKISAVKTGTSMAKTVANARAIGTKPGSKISAVKSKATPIAKPKPLKPKTKSKMTPEDKAYSDLLKKYGNDVTKIPGFKNGKGTM